VIIFDGNRPLKIGHPKRISSSNHPLSGARLVAGMVNKTTKESPAGRQLRNKCLKVFEIPWRSIDIRLT